MILCLLNLHNTKCQKQNLTEKIDLKMHSNFFQQKMTIFKLIGFYKTALSKDIFLSQRLYYPITKRGYCELP